MGMPASGSSIPMQGCGVCGQPVQFPMWCGCMCACSIGAAWRWLMPAWQGCVGAVCCAWFICRCAWFICRCALSICRRALPICRCALATCRCVFSICRWRMAAWQGVSALQAASLGQGVSAAWQGLSMHTAAWAGAARHVVLWHILAAAAVGCCIIISHKG